MSTRRARLYWYRQDTSWVNLDLVLGFVQLNYAVKPSALQTANDCCYQYEGPLGLIDRRKPCRAVPTKSSPSSITPTDSCGRARVYNQSLELQWSPGKG
ncbi:hypothetical protein T265_11667 [Opisthorchis viverrini]|uniref:Uncharacterized protein n=1 Tax=Opisthorchis viverrini TaxID=6198 RepID=A0A074Z8R3_OPIVI|nr:hypothetical protein T265_11667 [Opisthorchis viverrini]KER19610.1 hypothetical protein T265_11667 [Opisthorchis viverrini]